VNGPPPTEDRPPEDQEPINSFSGHHATPTASKSTAFSQQVSWWPVHKFVQAVLDQVNEWPTLGTPEWCSLDHDDPRKWAALLDGAQHWALRMDTCQEAECAASREISASADWSAISRRTHDQSEFYTQRPWLKRVAS
jgi:Protein of unknown function (DUF2742)